MKRLLVINTAFAFAFLSVTAQDSGDFELGGNLGLNFATVATIDNDLSANSRIGFNIGATGEYYFSDRWGIKARLTYDSKGWADGFFTNDDTGESFDTDYILNYLTIPVMANWHFGRSRNWYLHFGPYIGILASAKDSELGLDVKDAFQSTDLGLALGIGTIFRINDKTRLFLEFDGQSGLTEIFVDNSGEMLRNSRSALNFGVLINPQ